MNIKSTLLAAVGLAALACADPGREGPWGRKVEVGRTTTTYQGSEHEAVVYETRHGFHVVSDFASGMDFERDGLVGALEDQSSGDRDTRERYLRIVNDNELWKEATSALSEGLESGLRSAGWTWQE